MPNFSLSAVHIHLLLNHFPIVLSIVSPVLLAYGMFTKNSETIRISLFLFITMALVSIPVFLAGKEAIKTISALPGIDIRALVLHESIATVTFWLIIIVGFVSAFALFVVHADKETRSGKQYRFAILALSLILIAAVSATGYYGGNIRHTEIQE